MLYMNIGWYEEKVREDLAKRFFLLDFIKTPIHKNSMKINQKMCLYGGHKEDFMQDYAKCYEHVL